MRYILQAKVIPGKAGALLQALRDRSFGRGFPYGDLGENLRDDCFVDADGTVRWVETCYCRESLNVAMVMELPYFEPFMHQIEVVDARDPRFCDGYPHCNDCDCTKTVRLPGVAFYPYLEKLAAAETQSPPASTEPVATQWKGWLGKVQTVEEAERNATCSRRQVTE
jgi:hypothetical protein